MELHHRVEMINTLLEETEQKMDALQHALAAQARAKQAMQPPNNGSLADETPELKYEQAVWEKIRTGLTELRTLMEEVEDLEHQRGVSQ